MFFPWFFLFISTFASVACVIVIDLSCTIHSVIRRPFVFSLADLQERIKELGYTSFVLLKT